MRKYPGTNYKEIKALGEEETKAQLEESQCEGLKKSKRWFKASSTYKNPELENKLESVTYFSKKLLFQA